MRFVSISGLPLPIYPYVAERTDLDAVLSYCHYALNDTSLTELIPYLKAKNLGIINASAMYRSERSGSMPRRWRWAC